MSICCNSWCWVSVVVIIEIAFVGLVSRISVGKPISTTREGALLTIARIDDLTKWMAAIETAALGGLAYLAFGTESSLTNRISRAQCAILAVAGINLGIALLLSGSIFTSLGSVGARVHGLSPASAAAVEYDVAEWPLYSSTRKWKVYRLGYLITCKHWFWALGLAAVAVFIVALLQNPPKPTESKTIHVVLGGSP